MTLLTQQDTHDYWILFPRSTGWCIEFQVLDQKNSVVERCYHGPSDSIFDLEAYLDTKQKKSVRPTVRYLSGVCDGDYDGNPFTPVTFTVPGATHFGLQGVPDRFITSMYKGATFLYDMRTCVYFVIRQGKLHCGPSYFWTAADGERSFHLASAIPTTKAGWKDLSLRCARSALSHGYTYKPVILPGLDRQPWTRDQIVST